MSIQQNRIVRLTAALLSVGSLALAGGAFAQDKMATGKMATDHMATGAMATDHMATTPMAADHMATKAKKAILFDFSKVKCLLICIIVY